MNTPAVDVLLFQLGDHRLAVELHLVSSVLDPAEAQGMNRLDPRPSLDVDTVPLSLGEEADNAMVGLLDIDGPPMVLVLGEVLGAETITPKSVVALPEWLAGSVPDILRRGCAVIDQKVVWLLDLDTLREKSLF